MNSTFRRLLVFGTALCAVLPSSAVEVRTITLEECIQLALQKSLDIRLAQFAPEQARLDLSAAYAAWDPTFSGRGTVGYSKNEGRGSVGDAQAPASQTDFDNASFSLNGVLPTGTRYTLAGSYDHSSGITTIFPTNSLPIRTDIGDLFNTGTSIQLAQPLLRDFWIDRARLTIALSKQNLKTSAESVRDQVTRTIANVEVAYYNLIASHMNVRVQEKALELSKRSLDENSQRVKVGVLAPLDEEQSKAEVARIEADLILAQQTLYTVENVLKALISDDYGSLADVDLVPPTTLQALPVVFSRQDSWSKGLTLRSEILLSNVELEKQKITIRYTRNQLYPQLDITGSYGLIGRDIHFSPALGDISDLNNPNHTVGGVLSFPLSNRGARAAHKSAKLLQEQLLLRHKQIEQFIMVEIDNAIRVAQSAFERVKANDQQRDYAERAVKAEETKFANGKSTSFVVLRLQRDLVGAQVDYVRALADYNTALTRLAQAEGYTLDKFGIKLEFH
jgi:outer membrane protein TolC